MSGDSLYLLVSAIIYLNGSKQPPEILGYSYDINLMRKYYVGAPKSTMFAFEINLLASGRMTSGAR